jgi:hypothetical protein
MAAYIPERATRIDPMVQGKRRRLHKFERFRGCDGSRAEPPNLSNLSNDNVPRNHLSIKLCTQFRRSLACRSHVVHPNRFSPVAIGLSIIQECPAHRSLQTSRAAAEVVAVSPVGVVPFRPPGMFDDEQLFSVMMSLTFQILATWRVPSRGPRADEQPEGRHAERRVRHDLKPCGEPSFAYRCRC